MQLGSSMKKVGGLRHCQIHMFNCFPNFKSLNFYSFLIRAAHGGQLIFILAEHETSKIGRIFKGKWGIWSFPLTFRGSQTVYSGSFKTIKIRI